MACNFLSVNQILDGLDKLNTILLLPVMLDVGFASASWMMTIRYMLLQYVFELKEHSNIAKDTLSNSQKHNRNKGRKCVQDVCLAPTGMTNIA